MTRRIIIRDGKKFVVNVPDYEDQEYAAMVNEQSNIENVVINVDIQPPSTVENGQ
jgi:hypothetical protein